MHSNGGQKTIAFGFISILLTKTKAVKADFLVRKLVVDRRNISPWFELNQLAFSVANSLFVCIIFDRVLSIKFEGLAYLSVVLL